MLSRNPRDGLTDLNMNENAKIDRTVLTTSISVDNTTQQVDKLIWHKAASPSRTECLVTLSNVGSNSNFQLSRGSVKILQHISS